MACWCIKAAISLKRVGPTGERKRYHGWPAGIHQRSFVRYQLPSPTPSLPYRLIRLPRLNFFAYATLPHSVHSADVRNCFSACERDLTTHKTQLCPAAITNDDVTFYAAGPQCPPVHVQCNNVFVADECCASAVVKTARLNKYTLAQAFLRLIASVIFPPRSTCLNTIPPGACVFFTTQMPTSSIRVS